MRSWFRRGQRPHNEQRRRTGSFRPGVEGLEDRNLLAAPVISPINAQTVPAGKSLYIPVNGTDADGNPITYSVSSSSGQVTAEVLPQTNTFLRLSVAGFGDLTFQLFDNLTPRTVQAIKGLVDSDFYDGLTFHRIISNFVIQGGDPAGNGSGGPPAGFTFDDEFVPQSIFTGSAQLAMANSGKDTNGSQFFVTIGAQRGLDHNHTILGQLVRGQDVLDRIRQTPVNGDTPITPPVITKAEVIQNQSDAVLRVTASTAGAAATVTVTASDGTGGPDGQTTFNVTGATETQNSPPILGPVNNLITAAGTPITFNITATDNEGDPSEFLVQEFGTSSGAQIQVTPNGNNAATVTVTPPNGFLGPIRVRVGVKQQGATSRGTTGSSPVNPFAIFDHQTITISVSGSAITATGQNVTGNEGVAASGVTVANFTSANAGDTAANFTASINWGDGQVSNGTVAANNGGFRVTGTNTYREAGVFPVRVTITHSSTGASQIATATATIQDGQLTLTAVPITATVGTPLTNVVVATLTSASPTDVLADLAATINWGDGTTTVGTVQTRTGGGFQVVGTHTYARAGSFTATVSAADTDTSIGVTGSSTLTNVTATVGDAPVPPAAPVLTDNQRFVRQVYRDFLFREPDAGGLAAWTGFIDQGVERGEVAFLILGSLERRQTQVNLLYQEVLNRAPDPTGFGQSVEFLMRGGSEQHLRSIIQGSDEFFSSRASSNNTTYAANIFQALLGRTIDASTSERLSRLMVNEVPRQTVSNWIQESDEGRGRQAQAAYQTLLGRVPSQAEGVQYQSVLTDGMDDDMLLAVFAGSEEYLRRSRQT